MRLCLKKLLLCTCYWWWRCVWEQVVQRLNIKVDHLGIESITCWLIMTPMSLHYPPHYHTILVKQSRVNGGARAPLFPPCPFTSSSFPPFYFSLCFIGFTYFLLLSIPSLSTRIVPLHFQAGGRRRRPNLGLVCVLFCTLCYLYSLVKLYCGALFYLV